MKLQTTVPQGFLKRMFKTNTDFINFYSANTRHQSLSISNEEGTRLEYSLENNREFAESAVMRDGFVCKLVDSCRSKMRGHESKVRGETDSSTRVAHRFT